MRSKGVMDVTVAATAPTCERRLRRDAGEGGHVHALPRRFAIHRARPEDLDAATTFIASLSPESRFLRFFTGAVNIGEMARMFVATGPDRVNLFAWAGRPRTLVGHAGAVRTGEGRAEMAVVVADGWQGQGVGSALLTALAEALAADGVTVMVGEALPENRRIVGCVTGLFDTDVRFEGGWVVMESRIAEFAPLAASVA